MVSEVVGVILKILKAGCGDSGGASGRSGGDNSRGHAAVKAHRR